MQKPQLTTDLAKVQAVIESCTTHDQVDAAHKLTAFFVLKHVDNSLPMRRLVWVQRIVKGLRESLYEKRKSLPYDNRRD